MAASRTLRCVVYGAIAVLALCATWHQNVTYFDGGNPFDATVRFWKETLTTPASVSIMVDIFLLGLAVVVWMVGEAHRLGIRFVWAYVALGAFVAISVSVPLFLIARERRLAGVEAAPETIHLSRGDLFGLVLFGVPTLILTAWSFAH